ncbi:hypothetical protein COCSADRAFT_330060 [Bipolaris sorokiniana ND90Pr]|uniref:Uncharacterized protein n=1 Tax=Cochliobolus sativus (strain ND90Pr / ATCC 201652) TaxID=665912 RepID=M2T3S4_COCSN|nr:uncharacterized protein COCSADRAFT_330060 [Bipolaris sorokiniana ND90Pr]EMD63642.1 hypothetical protein COCSADRAFT_330060 [Bipolaris sorokiniana ND90Pr]
MASAQDLQPTCEDYDSDQSEQGYEFPGRSSANAANVSTKRSHPDDLNKEKPPPQERVPTNLDLRSDSGAPSQRSPPAAAPPTARPEAPRPPPPQPQQQPPPPPSTKTRRPTQSQSDQSRPKLTTRTTSQSSKPLVKQRRPTITQDPRPERSERERLPRRDSRVEPECTDPKCTTCGPNALPQHLVRPSIKPTQSARDIDRLSADTRSMRSDPASYYQSPPSPTQLRRPPTYRQEAAIVQPAVNPRRRPSTSRPRPMSYNGEPNSQYYTPGMPAPYPSPPQEHGPPPSNSAQWRQMPQYHHMAGMAPPVVAPYGAPQGYPGAYPYNHTPPPYDGPQRPNMPPRTSFNSARNGPAPLVTQAPSREQQYSARYGQPQSASQPRFPPQLQLQEGAYESDSGSETGSSEEDDDEYYEQPDPNDPRNRRALMAPAPPKIEQAKPKSKSKKQQRPPIRHANTTQVVDERPSRRMSLSQPPAQPQSLVIDDRRRKRTSRTIEEPSRRASVSRPAPPSRQIQSEYPSHRGQIVVANSSKSERRRSAQVYEQVYDHHPEDRRAAKAAREAKARAREEEEARREQEQYEAELAHQKRLNRTSKQYYQPPAAFDSDEESESEESEDDHFPPEAPAPPPPQARRRRPTDVGKGKERVLEHKTKRIESAAEEYISARRGAPGPLNDPIHNAARHSRTISMPSHSGSSGSERSRSNRTAVTNENNEIRLRVDANAPLSLQFNGDMEGRTLRMIPAENGMADLVISGGRDRESVYHNSDRGSIADDRKALVPKQPRRQAEEMTENSLRSSRRRRDSQVIREQRIERSSGQQRPLRQRAHTSSYYGE